jgi:prophage regulatory protein
MKKRNPRVRKQPTLITTPVSVAIPPGVSLIRLPVVEAKTGLKKNQLRNMEILGQFPRRVRISERASGWVLAEVDAWLEKRIADSRAFKPEEKGPPRTPKGVFLPGKTSARSARARSGGGDRTHHV